GHFVHRLGDRQFASKHDQLDQSVKRWLSAQRRYFGELRLSFLAVACQAGGHVLLQRLRASRDPGQHRTADCDSDREFFCLDRKHSNHLTCLADASESHAICCPTVRLSSCSVGKLGGSGGVTNAACLIPSKIVTVIQEVICLCGRHTAFLIDTSVAWLLSQLI